MECSYFDKPIYLELYYSLYFCGAKDFEKAGILSRIILPELKAAGRYLDGLAH